MLSTVVLFRQPLHLPPETLPIELINEDTTELSLIGRRYNKLSGISAFVTDKLSITVIVFILTRIPSFHKLFYLLFFTIRTCI